MNTESHSSTPRSDLALTVLAVMWGTSHVITKEILATHSPAFYTSLRFGLAAVCFCLVINKRFAQSTRRELTDGLLLGLLSFAGIGFYVAGLTFTQASKAGFITGLYLVFTPVVAFLLFKARPTRDHVLGLAVAIIGFALLSYPQQGEGVNWGDVLILVAAVAWAMHIAATSAFARRSNVQILAAIQVMVVAVLAYLAYFILKSLGLDNQPNPIDWAFITRIGYMAIVVTFIAALLQTWVQGRVSSTHAVLFYALEPATAAVYAYLRFGEQLGARRGVGAVLIVLGVMASKLGFASRFGGHRPGPLELGDKPQVENQA